MRNSDWYGIQHGETLRKQTNSSRCLPWKTSIRSNRKNEIVLCRLLLGHTHTLPTNISRITESHANYILSLHNSSLSISHLLRRCKAHHSVHQIPSSLSQILEDKTEESVQKVLMFLPLTRLLPITIDHLLLTVM